MFVWVHGRMARRPIAHGEQHGEEAACRTSFIVSPFRPLLSHIFITVNPAAYEIVPQFFPNAGYLDGMARSISDTASFYENRRRLKYRVRSKRSNLARNLKDYVRSVFTNSAVMILSVLCSPFYIPHSLLTDILKPWMSFSSFL